MNLRNLFYFNAQVVLLDAILFIFGAVLFNAFSADVSNVYYIGLIIMMFSIIHFVLNLMFGVSPSRRRRK